MNSKNLVFLAGKRTAFGANGGSFRDISPIDLAVAASQAALVQAKVAADEIDHVIVGSILHSVAESLYIPRHVGLKVGVPMGIPALGVNRLCGTGFQVIVEAYLQMLAGDTQLALVGGVENMSMAPYVLRGARWGLKMGHAPIQDMMMDSLTDTFVGLPMAVTAENLATQYQISREQADQFAFQSQSKYKEAVQKKFFQQEIVPFPIKDKKGNQVSVEKDEHPKPETTLEKLGQLKPVFQKGGVVTAGNASGIVDGAAMLVVATEAEAKRRNLTPLGRLVSYGISGCDPKIMGIGPVPAIQQALKKAQLKLSQIDLVEVNEAFAPQTLAVAKALELKEEKLNVKGGAIALGHPLAASGARIIQTLLYELQRQGKRYGIGSACIGGGQGIALVVEAIVK